MATTNHERVDQALGLLRDGLRPFVRRAFNQRYGGNAGEQMAQALGQSREWRGKEAELNLDAQALLDLMTSRWDEAFKVVLGPAERTLVNELRGVRNDWAHQKAFSFDDAYRALDSIERLLKAVGAAEQGRQVEGSKAELMRLRYEEQTRRQARQAAAAPVETRLAAGLTPWREVVTPHPDVASGRYQQAEFAADLAQVRRGEGGAEYRDPTEFFRRTYLTRGLQDLLVSALRRLSGAGGDPVVELQTNFGGGKTHSMLALFHLVSGKSAGELPGVEDVLHQAGVTSLPKASRAVLVGTALSPAQPQTKPDGVTVRTLWGELAWQLGGADGYSLVAEDDAHGVSPGSDALRDLFEMFSPCLVLIDEWVAFARMLYGQSGLPAGSFDANLSFAQALTEAARQAPATLVVAAMPSSQIEIGGEGGQAALQRLKNVFERMESPWRPASTEEGFEIVRRRLFQPITDQQHFAARNAVVSAFADLYRAQSAEFPARCREADYERRMLAAYPIHPELFDRLYEDWSSLDRFQRTRGVLRLMAAVIHALWERQDPSALILPGTVPIDEPTVQFELTRYLEDPWTPVIEKDVDGAHSLPLALDRENPNFGRYSAARRVARAIYVGSAPTMRNPNRGIEDRQIKLGCVQPGESVATYGDALRRLADRATHLYQDDRRYWFNTQPSVTRLAQDRAEQLEREPDRVHEEIKRRVRAQQHQRGDFLRVHPFPAASGDVPDEDVVRLVILDPAQPHSARAAESPARAAAAEILDRRGPSPRTCRNMLVFLAADATQLQSLELATRDFLAWKSIEDERERLNLDAFQANQARTRREQADQTVDLRIRETFQWLLVPTQPDPQSALQWSEHRLQGDDPLAVRASKKLQGEGELIKTWGATNLRLELDRIPLWRDDSIAIKQLWEYFTQYLYLPRLQSVETLLGAIAQGVALLTWESESFAYAEGWDPVRGRYLGLRAGQQGSVLLEGGALLIKPDAARRQLEADAAARGGPRVPPGAGGAYLTPRPDGEPVRDGSGAAATVDRQPDAPPRVARRFYGSVAVDPARLGRDAGAIAEAVVQHLAGLVGAEVKVTIEIQAEVPDGVPDQVVRIVTENCRTLKFTSQGFEID